MIDVKQFRYPLTNVIMGTIYVVYITIFMYNKKLLRTA